jgi:WD40 repeat protein
VVGLAASADGALIATASNDGVVRIWDAASHRRLLVLPGHRMPTFVVQIAPDGSTVVSGGRDGRLVRWQLDRRPRPAAALADLVRCRVPLRLDGDAALPRELDFDDPSCGW